MPQHVQLYYIWQVPCGIPRICFPPVEFKFINALGIREFSTLQYVYAWVRQDFIPKFSLFYFILTNIKAWYIMRNFTTQLYAVLTRGCTNPVL